MHAFKQKKPTVPEFVIKVEGDKKEIISRFVTLSVQPPMAYFADECEGAEDILFDLDNLRITEDDDFMGDSKK